MHFNALRKAKELRRFDFADAKELQTLGELLASADVVIEGSRPRALRALERIVRACKTARAQRRPHSCGYH